MKNVLSTLLVVFALAFASSSNAAEVKVEKVKGKRAIVQIRSGKLKAGSVYRILSPDEEVESSVMSDSSSGASLSRDYGLGMSLSFTSLAVEGSTSVTNISLSSSFLFNFGIAEVGPTVGLAYAGLSETTTLTFGITGGVNFIANKPGAVFVPGLGLTMAYTMVTSGGLSVSGLSFLPELQVKIFALGNSTALRFGLGYLYQTIGTGGVSLATTGFEFSGGLSVYF